jgi:hypothetical protein
MRSPLPMTLLLLTCCQLLQAQVAQPVPPGGETSLPPITVRPGGTPGASGGPSVNSGTPGSGFGYYGDGSGTNGMGGGSGFGNGQGNGYGNGLGDGSGYGQDNGGSISWDSSAIQNDSQLVGPYNQPVWTTQRPFGTTRSYVLPAGTAQVEQWIRPTWARDGRTKPETRMLEEFAIGLPNRFQLDIYERWNIEPNAQNNQQANHEGVQIELRWAMADWGVIPLNPTFYAEWVERGGPQDKPNKYELKMLMAEQYGDWLFASNIILEQEVAQMKETEIAWSNAIATPIIERKLMAGIESYWSGTTELGARHHQVINFFIGPSIQWRPTNRTFVDLVGLMGVTPESPEAQCFFIFGYQFGNRAAPASSFGRPAVARGN